MSGINTTAFIASIFGVDPINLPRNSVVTPWVDPAAGRPLMWEEYLPQAIDQSNPWKGRKLAASVVRTTKKNGEPFGRTDWKPYADMVVAPRTFAPAPVAAPQFQQPPMQYNPNVPPQFAPPPQQWAGQPMQGQQPPQYPQQPMQQAPQQPGQWPQQGPTPGAPPPQQWPGQPPGALPPGSWGR